MKLSEKISLLTFCCLLTLGSWLAVQKVGSSTMMKLGVTVFGIGAVMQLVQAFNNNSKPVSKQKR